METTKTVENARTELLKGMHEYIRLSVGDERAYMTWINLVPDEPCDEDFEFIANDKDLWVDACNLFGELIKQYD